MRSGPETLITEKRWVSSNFGKRVPSESIYTMLAARYDAIFLSVFSQRFGSVRFGYFDDLSFCLRKEAGNEHASFCYLREQIDNHSVLKVQSD